MAADPTEHVAQAKRWIAERRYPDAVRALRRALVSSPEHIEARVLLGTALLALERYDEVRVEMLAVGRKAPKELRAHRLLGEALLRSGKVDKAVEALRQALAIDPDDEASRELLAEAGEEPPPSTRTIDRWFDPEAVATVQTDVPPFVEERTGPGIVLPEAEGTSTSILVDPDFQQAIDDAGSSEITNPPVAALRAPVPQPTPQPVSRAAPQPVSRAAPQPVSRAASPGPVASSPKAAPQPALPRPVASSPKAAVPPPKPRAETEQLDLADLGAVDEPRGTHDGDSDTFELLSESALVAMSPPGPRSVAPTPSAARSVPAPQPAMRPAPAPRSVLPAARPPASTPPASAASQRVAPPPASAASQSVAPPPAAPARRSIPPGPLPAPAPSVPPPASPAPARKDGPQFLPSTHFIRDGSDTPRLLELEPAVARGRESPGVGRGEPTARGGIEPDTSSAIRTSVHERSRLRSPAFRRKIAAGAGVALVLCAVLGFVGRAWIDGRRRESLAGLVLAAEADGRPATLAAAREAAADFDDDASLALRLRLVATGVLEHAQAPAEADALLGTLSPSAMQEAEAQLGRAYLLLARGEVEGARSAATTLSADDALASEAARARALTALAIGDLARATAEARISEAAAPGSARAAALLATLLARSGDTVGALALLDGVPGGSASPAVRLARARAALVRRGAGDAELASREVQEVLGALAASSTPLEQADAHLLAAELALASGDLARAAAEVRQAQPVPHDELLRLERAEVLAATGAAEEARAWIAQLPPASSDPPRRARVLAMVALATNDLATAERAVAQAGEGGAVDLIRGRIAEASGRTAEAKSFYTRVPLSDAAMPASRTRLAALWLAEGMTAQAADAIAAAYERLPTDVELVLLFARIRLAQRDVTGARAAVVRALAGNPSSPRLLTAKAEVELAAGEAAAAAETLRGAITFASADATLQVALARALRRSGRPGDARAAVDAALRLDAGSTDALLLLAELTVEAGDAAGANAALARAEATGRAPAGELARARVRLLVATGAGAAGIATAEPLARAGRDAALFVLLGRLHAQAEQNGEAQAAFAQALRLDERDPDAHVGRALLAMRAGDLGGAGRALERALELAASVGATPELRARLEAARGRLRFESGSFADARERATAALALEPRCAEAQLLLASVTIEQGGDALTPLRAAAAGDAPPAEAIGRLALRLPPGAEACVAARRYLEAAPRGYDADAVRAVDARCR
jgi:tetratricopeptide (TPR) repeat protein